MNHERKAPLLIFLLLLFFQSCINEKKYSKDAESIFVKNIIGEKIIFSKSIKQIENEDSFVLNKQSKYNVITYYDGDCGVCYLQLSKWSEFIKSLKRINNDISFKYILSGNSKAVVKANLEEINFDLVNVYYDEKNEFVNKYPFLVDKRYENSSILIEKNNKIVYIGNPTVSNDILNKYIELLEN